MATEDLAMFGTADVIPELEWDVLEENVVAFNG
jgi:hypothetical protein